MIAARPRADAHRRRPRRAHVRRRAAPAAARGRRASSRRRSATSSTSRARPPTARSCAATSATRRCCWCREIYWDYTTQEVLVMERMERHPDRPRRRARGSAGIDLKRLARCGRGDLLHAGVPRRLLPRRHASRQHLRRRRSRQPRQVHRARLRDHGHAVGEGQELPRAELPRVLPPRLPSRGDRAHRVRMGAGRTRAWTSSRRRSAWCSSRSSTGR